MLFRKTVAVYCESRKEQTLREHTAEFLSVKAGGIWRNQLGPENLKNRRSFYGSDNWI
jgi:hypothetical protein